MIMDQNESSAKESSHEPERQMAQRPPLLAGNKLGKYGLLSKLGHGRHAEVWRANDAKGKEWALKIFINERNNKNSRGGGNSGSDVNNKAYKRELKWLKKIRECQNEHLCKSINNFHHDLPRNSPIHSADVIVFELGQFSLHNALVKLFKSESVGQNGKPDERIGLIYGLNKRLELCRQIISGLAALHSKGFVHRDLKTDNILLIFRPELEPTAQIIDYDLCAKVSDKDGTIECDGGTREYFAPELLLGGKCSKASDIWALGCIIYEIFTGKILILPNNDDSPYLIDYDSSTSGQDNDKSGSNRQDNSPMDMSPMREKDSTANSVSASGSYYDDKGDDEELLEYNNMLLQIYDYLGPFPGSFAAYPDYSLFLTKRGMPKYCHLAKYIEANMPHAAIKRDVFSAVQDTAIAKKVYNIIRACIMYSPDSRATAQDLLKHF